MEERRKFERKDSRVGIIYSIPNQGIRQRIDSAAMTIDRSLGGLLFRAFHPIEVGIEFKVKILNDKHILSHEARVVRCEPVAGARAWMIAAEFNTL
ncbi:MAG: PilZ domain-containing protein [Leptospiraceae bacterium]|nr:PilZ domain-containing protein [Leptospiraceae bacterium]